MRKIVECLQKQFAFKIVFSINECNNNTKKKNVRVEHLCDLVLTVTEYTLLHMMRSIYLITVVDV